MLRPDHHREFFQWEKIVLLGLTIRRCPGVWQKIYSGVSKYTARPIYEEKLDVDKIVELMINEQKVRRDFLAWANTASNNLRSDRIVLPTKYQSG